MKINHIGVSGGKDSTALLLWAVHESGYPRESLNVSFCDTGNESPLTYEFVRMLSEKVFPIQWLRPERDFYELAKWKKRFPSATTRFCTQFLKIYPTRDYVAELKKQGHEVVLHSGVRADESEERANLPIRGFDGTFGADVYRPLLTWGIDDVWAIHKKYGIEPNPLYKMGFSRVGCLPCIMSRKKEIALIAHRFPDRIQFLRDHESALNMTFFSPKVVPERFRSKPIVTKGAGEKMNVPVIDDVVRWSKTQHGGNGVADYGFDDFTEDDFKACPSSLGQCE